MVNPIIIATNALTVADLSALRVVNLSRMKRRSQRYNGTLTAKKEKEVKVSALLKEKFAKAWNSQEERLSKLKRHRSEEESYDFKTVIRYENGNLAYISQSISTGVSSDVTETYFDDLENIIETEENKYTYYRDSKQKEFEFNKEDGTVKHFNKNGREDTKDYLAKQKILKKRMEYETKTGKTLQKMSKLEKIVAVTLKNTRKLTLVEQMLAKKAKSRG